MSRKIYPPLDESNFVHKTGNETIAGTKTFSSDILIPDEVYGAGWNESLEPPTKNAVYDKIETLGGSSYTDEQAQDAVGGILTSTTSITLTYSDATPSITASAIFGTTAGTIAQGNHSHANDHVAATVLDTASIDMTISGQQISAAAIFGTTATTIAQGNHTHATYALDSSVVHNTGGETIAGTKTFSSDILIPDEVYGAGWDSSLESPTKNALYDKIESVVSTILTQAAADTRYVNVTGDTMTGDLILSESTPRLYLNTPDATTNGEIFFQSGGVNEWGITRGASGGSVPGDFGIFNYDLSAYSLIIRDSDHLATFTADVVVPDEVYGSGWNTSLEVPTKNAVYDKIETIVSYSDELAQDAIGAILTDTASIDLTYNDATPSITASAIFGTTATTIAQGNHVHTNDHVPVTVLDTASIDLTLSGQQISASAIFGTTATTVAQGNHVHTNDHVPVTVLDTASIDLTLSGQQVSAAAIFGTTSTTIAQGNHTHAATPPGGSNTQVQFNNSSAFGGDSLFIWDNTNKSLGIDKAAPQNARLYIGSGTGSLPDVSRMGIAVSINTTASYISDGIHSNVNIPSGSFSGAVNAIIGRVDVNDASSTGDVVAVWGDAWGKVASSRGLWGANVYATIPSGVAYTGAIVGAEIAASNDGTVDNPGGALHVISHGAKKLQFGMLLDGASTAMQHAIMIPTGAGGPAVNMLWFGAIGAGNVPSGNPALKIDNAGALSIYKSGLSHLNVFGGAAAGTPDITLGRNTTADARISVAGATDGFSVGAAASDLVIRTESGSILFDTAAGGGWSMKISNAAGGVVFGPGSAGSGSKPRFSSGTLLTTPEFGAMEYDGSHIYFTPNSTSGRADLRAEHVFELNANGSNIGAAIGDFFGANSSISLPASSRWYLYAELYFAKITNAGTVVITVTNSAANYTNFSGWLEIDAVGGGTGFQTTTKANIHNQTVSAQAFPATGSLTVTTNHFFTLGAVIDMNAAGNIRIRCTPSTASVTPLRGSWYSIRRLDNVGTFV